MDLNALQLISLKNQVAQNTASLGEKADQSTVTTLQNQVNGISASPKGVFSTLEALQADATANTTDGKKNIYIVNGSTGVQEVDTLNITGVPTSSGNVQVTLNGMTSNIAVTSGVAEVASLTVTAPCSSSGNVTVTLNGVGTNVALDSGTDTTTDLVATKIRNTAFSGWTTGGTGSVVTFTATAVGVKTDASYSAGTTGATGTMTTTTQGVDADTTTTVATKIRGTSFTGWTTGGSGTSVTFTKTTIGVVSTPSFSGGTTGATGTMSVTTAGVNASTSDWFYWNGSAWADGGVYQSAADSETIDVRNGADGITYSSAGNSTRSLGNSNAIDFQNQKYGNIIDNSNYIGKTVSQIGVIPINQTLKSNTYIVKITSSTGEISGGGTVLWYFTVNGTRATNYVNNGSECASLLNGFSWSNINGIGFFIYSPYGTYVITDIYLVSKEDYMIGATTKLYFLDNRLLRLKSIYERTLNFFNKDTVKYGIKISAGIISGTADDFVSDFIYCYGQSTVYRNILGGYSYSLYYNANKEHLGYFTNDANATAVPVGAYYIRVAGSRSTIDSFMVGFDSKILNSPYIPYYQVKENSIPIRDNVQKNPWWNKIGDSLGDSITGQGFFQSYTKKYFRLNTFYNHGIGGTKLSGAANAYGDSMWMDSRINSLNANADFVTVLGGQNDGENPTIGDITQENYDTNTYAGALNVIISKILYKYQKLSAGYYTGITYTGITQVTTAKNIIIFICTPFYVPNTPNVTKNLSSVVREIAKLWSLNVVDFAGKSGFNSGVKDVYWSPEDRIHPLELGHKERLAPVLIGEMERFKPINFDNLYT